MDNISADRLMITLTGPSGAGKGTILRALCQQDPKISPLVTATTRPARKGEVHGQHYFFLSKTEFLEYLENNGFLEHNGAYHGQMYGTLRHVVEEKLQAGHDLVVDVNWVGVRQIRAQMRPNLLSIALLPPSYDELERRLQDRQRTTEEDPDMQRQRLISLKADMQHIEDPNHVFVNGDMIGSRLVDYDYVIVNDDFEETLNRLRKIIREEREKRV